MIFPRGFDFWVLTKRIVITENDTAGFQNKKCIRRLINLNQLNLSILLHCYIKLSKVVKLAID